MGYFKDLYDNNREFALLEWLYLAITAVFIFFAGLTALLNQSFGVGILIIPLVSFTTFAMNLVCWSLIKTIADHFLKTKKKDAKAKKIHQIRK